MSREKFDLLVPMFSSSDDEIQQERLTNKEIKRIQNSGPKSILDSYEKKLFFTLYYLKSYPTFDLRGFHFGLSAGHAHDYILEYLPVLQRSLEKLVLLCHLNSSVAMTYIENPVLKNLLQSCVFN